MTDIVEVANLSDVVDYKIYSKIGIVYSFLLFSLLCASGIITDEDCKVDLCYKNRIILNMHLSINDASVVIYDKDDKSKEQRWPIKEFCTEYIYSNEENFSVICYFDME